MDEDARGATAWKAQTSAFDRVRSVVETASQPRSASAIAEAALVAENTARDHLDRLVDMHVLVEIDRGGTSLYTPDPLYQRAQTIRELLDEYDHDGLIELKEDLLEQIETWETEFGVTSPGSLRECAAEADKADQISEIRTTASDWELVAYRLRIVDDAIENYATYSRDTRTPA